MRQRIKLPGHAEEFQSSLVSQFFNKATCPESILPLQRGAVVQWLGRSLITRPVRVQFPGWEASIIRCTNLPNYIRDCECLCLLDETLKAVGPFHLVAMPGEVNYPTQGVNV